MRSLPLLLALVCVLTLFTGLGHLGPVDVGEARDAEIARELIRGREPLTPLYAHEPAFEKPIAAYAPEVLAQLVARHPGKLSRMLRAVGALMLVLLTASVGGGHFGGRAGWFSGTVLASAFLVPVVARTDSAQIFGTF